MALTPESPTEVKIFHEVSLSKAFHSNKQLTLYKDTHVTVELPLDAILDVGVPGKQAEAPV